MQVFAPNLVALLEEAMASQAEGRLADAEAGYLKLLAHSPGDVAAMNNLGLLFLDTGRLDAARELLSLGVSVAFGVPEMHANLGLACKKLGLGAEAVVAFCRALQLRPDYPEALNNLGSLLHDLGELKLATDLLQKAVALRPDWALAHFNLGVNLLLDGQFEAGWPEYAWRWGLGDGSIKETLNLYGHIPPWQGESIAGKTLLLHGEQGFGDSLQFVRYVPRLAALGTRVRLHVPSPLVRLLASVSDVDMVLGNDQPVPLADFRAALLDVPGLFGIGLKTILSDVPYLHPPSPARNCIGEGAGLRIGLVWAGSAHHENDSQRSLNILDLMPVLEVPGLRFFSLQMGLARKQLKQVPEMLRPVDVTGTINDFADTAAILAGLDLVISVDTSVAHLAGALGRPVWILLPPNPDWRWLQTGDASPWYPSATLVRRKRNEPWLGVARRLAAILRDGLS